MVEILTEEWCLVIKMYWCAKLLPEILKNVQRELFWIDIKLKKFYFCIVVFCVLSWTKWNLVTAYYLRAELWRQKPLSLASDCTLLLFSDTWAFGSWKNWLVGTAGWTAQPACGESWGLCLTLERGGHFATRRTRMPGDCIVFLIIHFSSSWAHKSLF